MEFCSFDSPPRPSAAAAALLAHRSIAGDSDAYVDTLAGGDVLGADPVIRLTDVSGTDPHGNYERGCVGGDVTAGGVLFPR